MENATVLPLTLSGTVVRGRGKGRGAGMPTANIDVSGISVLPPYGVYASRVTVGTQVYAGVTNVGLRPTADSDPEPTVETFIIGFDGSLYGEKISAELLEYLRPTVRMNSLDEVREQVEKNARKAVRLFGKQNPDKP